MRPRPRAGLPSACRSDSPDSSLTGLLQGAAGSAAGPPPARTLQDTRSGPGNHGFFIGPVGVRRTGPLHPLCSSSPLDWCLPALHAAGAYPQILRYFRPRGSRQLSDRGENLRILWCQCLHGRGMQARH
ncbi:hypothetical protein NDU88_004441 [Pleurodeles waltl]|uniref:Uncharacterized protein n=1 Tax=Pleurodeles waltl TaxID=8319 RepID=A0AAV7TSK1_PLEWA|nr:hypothetical protein NDU88_004441 [Pleurodeles waltl]